MSLNLRLSDTAANAQADALAVLANGGYLRIYDGTQPADANAVTTQKKLAELRFGTPAFMASVAGVITANALTSEADAPATGIATWYRVFQADGVTGLWDGSAGSSGCNLNLAAVNIQQHALVSISSFQHTVTE